jgi:hypothetical protein
LDYDSNFGALIRRKSKFPLDGIPIVLGVACLLKQFHPSYMKQVFAYLGQFIRANLSEAFSEVDNKPAEVSRDICNILIFIEQLALYSSIPRSTIHAFIPPYIFDALKINVNPNANATGGALSGFGSIISGNR